MKAKKSKPKKSTIIIKPPTLHCDWDKLGFDPFDPAGIESAIKISESPDPLFPKGFGWSPHDPIAGFIEMATAPSASALSSMLRLCGDRFEALLNDRGHVLDCALGLLAGKVVVVQRRKDGKGRIAFFSPRAKWKKVKVRLGEKW